MTFYRLTVEFRSEDLPTQDYLDLCTGLWAALHNGGMPTQGAIHKVELVELLVHQDG